MGNLNTKHCFICKTYKPLDSYHKNVSNKDGRQFYCIQCTKEKRKTNICSNVDCDTKIHTLYKTCSKHRVYKRHKVYFTEEQLELFEEIKKNTKRSVSKYKTLREQCIIRDSNTCQMCKTVGGNLQCHHIVSRYLDVKGKYNLDSVMLLCSSCHSKAHFKPYKYPDYITIVFPTEEILKEAKAEKSAKSIT